MALPVLCRYCYIYGLKLKPEKTFMRFLSAFIPSKGNLVTKTVGRLYYCMEVF